MRPAVLLMEDSESNLRLVAQCGALDIVLPYMEDFERALPTMCERVSRIGMRVTVIERFIPHQKILHDLPGRDAEIAKLQRLVRVAGSCGIETLCYNWMPCNDWTRTSTTIRERGGALVTAFDIEVAAAGSTVAVSGNTGSDASTPTSAEKLWSTLKRFLDDMLPVCEECNVALAIHPDDPPLPLLNGHPQINFSVAQSKKVTELVPSPFNGVCFCLGTYASAGEDIPHAIRSLGSSIKFVHFRDVICEIPGAKFRESWQDNGDTCMATAIRTLKEIHFAGPIRPDHVPTLEGEDNSLPGYHILGRLMALGYIKGLLDAT